MGETVLCVSKDVERAWLARDVDLNYKGVVVEVGSHGPYSNYDENIKYLVVEYKNEFDEDELTYKIIYLKDYKVLKCGTLTEKSLIEDLDSMVKDLNLQEK